MTDTWVVLGITLVINIMFQLIKLAIDQDVVNEGSHDFPVIFGSVEIGSFGWPINHSVTGGIGTFPGLDVVPMLNGQVSLEAKDFETDP